MKKTLDYKKYSAIARQAAADGQVLLENNGILPLKKGLRVAVFGRIQTHYYKSGTGSGGMVNVNRVVGILDALLEAEKKSGAVKVDRTLMKTYREWEKENPFDSGKGWGQEPWCQEEMPLKDDFVKKIAAGNDCALVIIGRLAGEDRDNSAEEGAYYLSKGERAMLDCVRHHFKKIVIILNVGNIIDMNFVREYRPDAVLYAWQGGMLGGYGTADVLTGAVNPSGSLTDTIAKEISDYPSEGNFGDPDEAVYAEDIFVGYRYFETFKKDRVLYPFGYGLSYTQFKITAGEPALTGIKDPAREAVTLSASVKNTGKREGKVSVKIFIKAPNGRLGKSARVLAAFWKTGELSPGEEAGCSFRIPLKNFASFDETGKCGLGTGWVLEKGEYGIYAGQDVRSAALAGSVSLSKDLMIEKLENACGPVKAFKKMTAVSEGSDGSVRLVMEDASLRKDTMTSRRKKRLPKDLPLTGDRGYKLKDVKSGKVSMDAFISQFDRDELLTIIRGEGMGSAKVTPGTASAFGGISPALKDFGIPVGCMDDGPSGMRLDSGVKAFSLPNGTLLASTFDEKLNEELFSMVGIEMLKNRVDVLLGPGMNIHRHPLNGRNFEYFSEDPYLTGVIGAAQIRGMQKSRVTGTIKHFCCNNQETGRQQVDPVLTERALREIYLKGYEIAVQDGADSVMNTYCRVNGTWTSGCYDLNTTILREQWGFEGIVMTDWWAQVSDEGGKPDRRNFAALNRAQCDLYMCVPDAGADAGDNARSSLDKGELTLGELQRTAKNICGFLMKYAPFIRAEEEEIEVNIKNAGRDFAEKPIEVEFTEIKDGGSVDLSGVTVRRNEDYYFGVDLPAPGYYEITLTARSLSDNELAQMNVVLFMHVTPCASYAFQGAKGWKSETKGVFTIMRRNIMHLHFGSDGLELKEISFRLADPLR
ncbi:MAG: glycoside hydrolase family 3 C-terminal domain-containing protein [Lachnospiraceae bacterium]|nr:glycoside hydrolase family 3 C-terminal domain-containing protein [Lachnospiraceae bacterium]